MSLNLQGVMTETLGGFRVVRGFAKLSELAACSFADDYQRDLKPKHQQDIQAYYERGEYLFFPKWCWHWSYKRTTRKRAHPKLTRCNC